VCFAVLLLCNVLDDSDHVLFNMCCGSHIDCSIEEAKQRTERERQLALAEAKKANVRHNISNMRDQFKSFVERNMTLPLYLQLHKKVYTLLFLVVSVIP